MLKYKTIVAAVLTTAAFAVHAEIPQSHQSEWSGPQPAPYGVADPVLTPADFKFAEFPRNEWSGPQPAPQGIADPAPTPADFKFAEFPRNEWSGPQPAPTAADLKFVEIAQDRKSRAQKLN